MKFFRRHDQCSQNNCMKIGIIGTFNRDTVKLPDGTIKKGWGGIFYNVVALSKSVGNRSEIYPVANVGHDAFKEVASILKKSRGVRLDYLNKVSEKNNHCFLTYFDYEGKSEILKGGVKPLKYNDVRLLPNCDIILLNYISGRDIYLQSLRKLRRNFEGKIYIDIHSLTLGKRKDGLRYLRRPSNWLAVIEIGDYIQMNRLELDILTSAVIPTVKNRLIPDVQLKKLVGILRENRIKATEKVFIITAGNEGCYLYFYFENKWQFQHIPPRKKVRRKDTTGCGDCFSAGFIAGLLESSNLSSCAEKGNRVALDRIEGNLKIIQDA